MAEKRGCGVEGCNRDAVVEVIHYVIYSAEQQVFFEQDCTSPYLCAQHMMENEEGLRTERGHCGAARYPFTNSQGADDFTIYCPLN